MRVENGLTTEQAASIRTNPPQLMTEKECAAFAQISTRTLRKHRRARLLPFVKVGRAIRYRLSEVQRAFERMEVRNF